MRTVATFPPANNPFVKSPEPSSSSATIWAGRTSPRTAHRTSAARAWTGRPARASASPRPAPGPRPVPHPLLALHRARHSPERAWEVPLPGRTEGGLAAPIAVQGPAVLHPRILTERAVDHVRERAAEPERTTRSTTATAARSPSTRRWSRTWTAPSARSWTRSSAPGRRRHEPGGPPAARRAAARARPVLAGTRRAGAAPRRLEVLPRQRRRRPALRPHRRPARTGDRAGTEQDLLRDLRTAAWERIDATLLPYPSV